MTNKTDETDLVDAKDLPSEEDITEARHRVAEEDIPEPSATERDPDDDAGAEEPFAMQMESPKPGQTTIASLRERLAAFLVDVGVLWLLYWGALDVFHKLTLHRWTGPVPTIGYNALLFHGIFLVLAFLYFFLFEAAFFATVGKFCCWMYVRHKDGRHAGAFGIFIRNFFRLVELLTGGLLTWVPMELSRRHQRLGDMAAGTIVIKKHAATAANYSIDSDQLASAFGRSIAQLIDLALVLIWLAGYGMLINDKTVILSQWLVLAFPCLFILFWTLVQLMLETTPGLWLLGYTITHEDGGRLTFAGALLRVLTAPVDLLLGLPSMVLSLRKQKIGDLLAATLVSRQPRRWKGAIGSLVVVAVCVGIAALGLFINPLNNIYKTGLDFNLEFMPQVEGLPIWNRYLPVNPPVLALHNFRFGVNDLNTLRTPPVYVPGETVFLLSEISGYARKDRKVWIQEDLTVQYPDGTIGLKQENAVDYNQIWDPGVQIIKLDNHFPLPPTAEPGVYLVTVTIRDMLANKFTVTETQSFTVKAPAPVTSPLEAAPAEPTEPPSSPSPLPVGPQGATQPPPAPMGAPTPAAPAPTVPSSPIPVMPAGEAPATTPGAPSTPTAAPAPTPAPAGGFTALPGPSMEPTQETAPPPTIPVPPPAATPPSAPPTPTAAPMPAAPSTTPAPAQPISPVIPTPTPAPPLSPPVTTPGVAPTPSVPPPSPLPPAPPAIVEKTLTPTPPTTSPSPAAPIDTYGKPAAKVTPAPAVVPAAPAPAPAKEPAKPVSKEKVKATAPPPSTKAPADLEMKKAAEKELQKMTPTAATPPAKPAADIPSAAEAKKQTEPAPSKPKKKKASSGGSSSGGYMP